MSALTFPDELVERIQKIARSEGRAVELDAEFDFVDMAIMAISERLNITRVCTFDQRDFSIFRPKHCSYLELIPSA